MKELFIADPHFGSEEIIGYCNRPFDNSKHMDDTMVNWWNEIVGKDDKIYVVGDFSMYDAPIRDKILLQQLNGYKVLIMGNHDKDRPNAYKYWIERGFDEVYAHPIILHDFIVVTHEPPQFMSDATPFFYIYGHVHHSEMYQDYTRRSACVCVERTGYAPVSLDSIKWHVDKLKKDKEEQV